MHYRETGFVPGAWRTNQVLKNQRLPSMDCDCLAAILWALVFCQDRNLRIIVLIPVTAPEIERITRYDAFSAKVVWTKLAFAGDDARACDLWCRSYLQRDF